MDTKSNGIVCLRMMSNFRCLPTLVIIAYLLFLFYAYFFLNKSCLISAAQYSYKTQKAPWR